MADGYVQARGLVWSLGLGQPDEVKLVPNELKTAESKPEGWTDGVKHPLFSNC